MKSICKIAGCGVVMLVITWCGWAAEPQKDPSSASQPAPVMFVPPAGGTKTAGRPSPFSAKISADFIKKVMETSARIEKAKRQIADRQAKLYATNPDIKANRELMVKRQKEINRILDADPELAELKMSRDILWSTMPALPKGRTRSSLPHMPLNR